MSRPEPPADSIAAFGPRPALLPRLSLVVIRAVDPRRLADFYAALGMAFEIEQHGNGPVHFVSTDTGIIFEIYPRRDDEPTTTGIRLGFTTVALDAVVQSIEGFGGQIVTPVTMTLWGRRAVLIDPEGHKVEITEKLDHCRCLA
jgi:predicted enzyme related to lactoylglutathione lyase